MDSPYSKTPKKSGVIHGCTTFGSQVITAAYSGRETSVWETPELLFVANLYFIK